MSEHAQTITPGLPDLPHVGWREVVTREHLPRLLVLCLAIWLHAANTPLAATTMPEAVGGRDAGALSAVLVLTRHASPGTPVPSQPRGQVGEAVARLMAGDDAVGAKMANVVAQLTPGRQHCDLDVVDDGERQAGALGQPLPLVAVGEGEPAAVTDRGSQHSHVGRRRRAELRDHEPAVVQLVRTRLRQNAAILAATRRAAACRS